MGAVNIDNTGTGAAVTLSSDGTSLLLDGSAIGGGGGSATLTIDNKTSAYTVVAGDLGKIINCTSGTFTVSLDAAATLGAGFNCWIWNTSNTSTDVITIDPNGAETIDGVATLVLQRGEGVQIVCDGTNWQTGDKKATRGYAENFLDSGVRPIASGSMAFAIGRNATATNTDTYAFGRLANASGVASSAFGYLVSASASYSTSIGANSGGDGSKAVVGAGAMALGGSYASGTDSFAAAIANNTSTYGATGANSVAVGRANKASTTYAATMGGYLGVASAYYSTVLGGRSNSADGQYSVVSGYGATANGVSGKKAHSPVLWASAGGTQTGELVLLHDTTDATATVLTSTGTGSATTNQVILPNNSAYAFHGTIVARQQASGGTASAAWKVEGLIRREGSAGTTVLVNSATTVIDNTPGWTLALSADTTNGGLAITATGAAATNIRWVATIQTSEVTYA